MKISDADDSKWEKQGFLGHATENYDFEDTEDASSRTPRANGRVTNQLILSSAVSLFGSFQFGCKSAAREGQAFDFLTLVQNPID